MDEMFRVDAVQAFVQERSAGLPGDNVYDILLEHARVLEQLAEDMFDYVEHRHGCHILRGGLDCTCGLDDVARRWDAVPLPEEPTCSE